MTPRVLVVFLAAVPCGCSSQADYLIDRAVLAAQAPQALDAIIPARRAADGQSAHVRLRALDLSSSTSVDLNTVRVLARARNPLVTAGSVLTWIGTAISLGGTFVAVAGKGRGDDGLFLIGGITALAAEPLMLTGTGLWIAGANRRPYEVQTPIP